MSALEIQPKVGLEWRISEVSAMWLMAGREITEDEPRMSDGDAITFKMRVAVLVYFGVMQVTCCLLGIIWCELLGYANEKFISITHGLLVVLVFACTHIANSRRAAKQKRTVDIAAFILSALCVIGAPLIWRLRFSQLGWHWSTGASVWKWGGTIGAILLYEHPLKYGSIAFLAGVAGDVLVMVVCRELVSDAVEDSTGFAFTMLSVLMSYALFPLFMASLFRRQCQQHLVRLEAVAAQEQRLQDYRASSRFLIFSLIPPIKATKLHHASPARWHRGEHDEFADCSLVQMDVSGFTALSSTVGSEDLVDFINAIFTSVEYAAECIGKAWMVELIGDCAKFIIGGPYGCADHAYRACVLGATITELCQRVAKRLHIDVSVRVGIHTGSVSAAVTASRMPRYLIYGRDTHIVEKCEAGAGRNQVLASAATAQAVGAQWPLKEAHEVLLDDGTPVRGWEVDGERGEAALLEARACFAALDHLLAHFANAPIRYPISSLDDSGSGLGSGSGSGEAAARSQPACGSFGSALGRHTTRRLTEQISEISIQEDSMRALKRKMSLFTLPRSVAEEAHSLSQRKPTPDGPLTTVARQLPGDLRIASRETSTGPSWENGGFNRTSSAHKAEAPSGWQVADPEAAAIAALWMSERESGLEHMREQGLDGEDEGEETVMEPTLETPRTMHDQQTYDEQWLPEHGASSLQLQRTVTAIFLGGATAATALQTCFLLAVHLSRSVEVSWAGKATDTAELLVVLLPGLLLALLVSAAVAGRLHAGRLCSDWASGWPQTVATVLLVLAAVVLEGMSSGRGPTRTAIVWAAAAAFIPCTRIDIGSRKWYGVLVVYWCICFGLAGWEEMAHEGGSEEIASAVEWWRDVLICVNFWIGGAVLFAPMILGVRNNVKDQICARYFLAHTRKQVLVEGKLLQALLPKEVKERFLRGDKLIADRIQGGTVLFVYVVEYCQVMLNHGAPETIQWINKVFAALDRCIGQTDVIKVETFNNFLLVYSRRFDTHVAETLFLGLDMLGAIEGITRPDGTPTTLKLGVSSGDFTAGIIGMHTPRYSIFGDTVNTASRMASSSQAATSHAPFIHLSPAANDQLDAKFAAILHQRSARLSIRARSSGMSVKGKGWMHTFCLSAALSTPSLAPLPSASASSLPPLGSAPSQLSDLLISTDAASPSPREWGPRAAAPSLQQQGSAAGVQARGSPVSREQAAGGPGVVVSGAAVVVDIREESASEAGAAGLGAVLGPPASRNSLTQA